MGAVVAIDVRNGDVLALASRPAYDPNVFAGGITPEDWTTLTTDEWKPLRNRAISGQYSPGSTYKPFVALAGLIEGKIDPETTVFCPGYYRLGRRVYVSPQASVTGSVVLADDVSVWPMAVIRGAVMRQAYAAPACADKAQTARPAHGFQLDGWPPGDYIAAP